MKFELLIFGITLFLVLNTYYDGKYVVMLKGWKKYYEMGMYAFLGLSLYLFIKKDPMHSRKLLSHAQGMIKYMPIDKDAADMLTPFLDLTSKNLQPDYNSFNSEDSATKRILKSGNTSKRSVSETKKKFVASRQNWHCNDCREQLPAWFEVDHVTRLDRGGTNNVDNLVALCRNCHGKKTAMENL